MVFLDNEAARHALVKGYSPLVRGAELVSEAWLAFAACSAAVWFARVPTRSNPADAPSRGQECPQWRRVPAVMPHEMGLRDAWFCTGK